MFFNSQSNSLVDIKDLFFEMLRKILAFIIVGFLFVVLFGGYKTLSYLQEIKKAKCESVSNVLDTTIRLPDETDLEYSERVLDVNRANDLIRSIDVLNKQIDNQRKYVSNSVYMQIESENEAVTTVNLIVLVDDIQTSKVDLALASTYKQYILSGDYLKSVSEEHSIDQEYITELISVNYDTSSIMIDVADNTNIIGIITIKVIGPSLSFTDKIMDSIIDNVNLKSDELNKIVGSHELIISERQSSYIVDTATRDRQINITNRFENLQQQIVNYDKSLDEISKRLGVSKERIYSYYSLNDYDNNITISVPIKSIIKYSLLGLFIGFFIVFVIITLNYAFSKKFLTQGKFFCRFSSIKKIGVLKPDNIHSSYLKHINILSGDDNRLSNTNNIRLIASNIKNLTIDMNNILFTGTANISKIENLVRELSIKADVKTSVFDDPIHLAKISDYDGVIIVEQRNYSDCNLIADEIDLILNSHTKLIGVIII